MIEEDELRRLREGAAEADPPGDVDVLEVAAADPSGALSRVRGVLEIVLPHSQDAWPSVDEWARLLPDWFIAACVDDRELRDCVLDRWSLRAWVYWFQPEHRKWRWWDARTAEGQLVARLLVLERPYLRGALEWLLKVAAAT